MLSLVNIKKEYRVADTKVEALKGISLSFRKNEFVSILGPSGCGKTTTLNIIGGLDRYTSGDLFINGTSTKKFKDKDWDIYRNHRVGFIFQAYNLIPHQTVLENVELALTIAGISQKERTQRAKEALNKVGLKGQYNKKPNQLSGGQCQRVAIARALVNEPEILLADEPTGALDTQTSVQIMELIKEISKEKLVIMVTHNPELAQKYSTRIIRLLDGSVLSDSNPYSFEEEQKETFKPVENEKAKMSWWTSFKLSFKNLLSKKGRSILISIAGSIGIIGVASVLSVSTGVNGYITSMQDDMLSGNPITISENTYDLNSLMNLMTTSQKAKITNEVIKGNVNVDYVLDQILEMVNNGSNVSVKNTITDEYLDFLLSMPKDYYADINYDYGYDLSNNIYTTFNKMGTGEGERVLSLSSIVENYESVLSHVDGIGSYSTYITSLVSSTNQLSASNSYIETQYDILTGTLPSNSNEMLLVLDSDEKISDLILAELGYFTQEEFIKLAQNSQDIANKVDGASHNSDKKYFDYSTILNKEFYYVSNSNAYKFNKYDVTVIGNNKVTYPKFDYVNDITDTKEEATALKISGIVKLKEGRNYGCLSTGLYYTSDLALQMHEDALIDYNNSTDTNPNTFTRYVASTEYVGSSVVNASALAICTYKYSYYNYKDKTVVESETGYVGQSDSTSTFISAFMGGGSGTGVSKSITSRMIGYSEKPNSISIYPNNFDEKNKVTDYLDKWNDENFVYTYNGKQITYADRTKITYTDNVGVIISMVKTLINIVTYALIAFTALSLVVSCFMIAIITYVSIMERVKEIGVIRSLGGRKKDVSHLFNAETFMLGLSSGVIGVLVTYLITFILNLALSSLAGANIACFYPYQALIMITLSIVLTVLSGAIPARSAAKQDPVNALRSE